MNSRLEKDEDVVTISSCSSSASNSSTEKSSRIERSKELSHRLPPVKAQPLNGFDDSDFLSESTPDDLSAGDIRWLFNQKTGSFSVYSKMVEQKKRYEQQIVLPVHPSIRNSGESVGLHLHRNIFNQAFQDLTLNPNENLPLPSSHTAYLSNNEQVYLHDGRYKSEFDEIRLIGKGGFAKVTEVRHKVDKQHYAVKRIPVKSPKNITLEKLSQEVTILAKLTKRPSPRIVRYHAAWLEEEYASGNSPKKEDDRPPALSSSSSSSSSLEELEEEGTSFHDLNDDHSSASIVFEDTEGTPINESKAGQVSYFRSSSSITSVKETTMSKQGIYLYEKEEDIVQSGESVICHEQTSRRQVMDSEKFREQVAGDVALRHPRRRHSSKPMMKYVLCIQMELCGKTLSEWLRQRNNSQERDGLFSCVSHRKNIYILKQILEGIHFVHQQDILHRDLKPLNVFLTEPQLDVKIGDFGLAREVICQEEDDGELVNPRQFGRQLSTDIGTSPYIAPEQQHGGDYDSKADMYSFGIIKYEMFHPFSTGMERSICIKSLRDGGDIPTELVKSWPEEAKLIKDLTSQDKMLRPSASELLKRCTYCDHKQQAQEYLQTQLNHRDSVITEKNKELMDTRAELASKDEELKTLKEERELERREGEKRDAELEAMKRKLKEMEEKVRNMSFDTSS